MRTKHPIQNNESFLLIVSPGNWSELMPCGIIPIEALGSTIEARGSIWATTVSIHFIILGLAAKVIKYYYEAERQMSLTKLLGREV